MSSHEHLPGPSCLAPPVVAHTSHCGLASLWGIDIWGVCRLRHSFLSNLLMMSCIKQQYFRSPPPLTTISMPGPWAGCRPAPGGPQGVPIPPNRAEDPAGAHAAPHSRPPGSGLRRRLQVRDTHHRPGARALRITSRCFAHAWAVAGNPPSTSPLACQRCLRRGPPAACCLRRALDALSGCLTLVLRAAAQPRGDGLQPGGLSVHQQLQRSEAPAWLRAGLRGRAGPGCSQLRHGPLPPWAPDLPRQPAAAHLQRCAQRHCPAVPLHLMSP